MNLVPVSVAQKLNIMLVARNKATAINAIPERKLFSKLLTISAPPQTDQNNELLPIHHSKRPVSVPLGKT